MRVTISQTTKGVCKLDIYLNVASRFPEASLDMRKIVEEALRDGYSGVSILPVWSEFWKPVNYWSHVKFAEKPWNTGTPFHVLWGKVRKNPKAPQAQDLMFPWFKFLWKPLWQKYMAHGVQPIVHSFYDGEPGEILRYAEVNPGMRKTGMEIVDRASHKNFKLVFDPIHAERELRPDEEWSGDHNPIPLGDWKLWLAEAIKLNVLGLFDFHLSQEQVDTMDMRKALEMLYFAWDCGYTGPVRVEAVGLREKQWKESRTNTQHILAVLQGNASVRGV